MANDEERLIVALEARIRDFERNMQRASQTAGKQFGDIERRAKISATRLESSLKTASDRVNASFKNFGAGMLSGIVAGLSVDKLKSLLDGATQITNALKVAGLAGADLTKVYDRLYQSAQRNAAPLQSLVTLYSRVSGAQKELGVSSEEILTLTDNVAKSVRLTGGSAAEASGALLQLSQALGGGKLQAEEYNSLVDGLRPLLQAAAAGMKQAGGSVAELTRLVKNGEVSSRAFFDSINAGAHVLDQKLAGSTMTTSQGFVQVGNSLLDAARKFDETTEASKTLGNALGDLAGYIESVNVDNIVADFQRYVSAADDAIAATNNLAYALGQKLGLGTVGELLVNNRVGAALGLYSGDAVARRMAGDVPQTPGYLQAYAKHYGQQANATAKTTAKQDRLAVDVKVDITEPKYAVPESSKGGTAGASTSSAVDLIKSFEGFIATPKWDVNAYRVGYGSDTVTLADGSIQKVVQGMSVSVADANRDLVRRVGEFQAGVKGQIGANTFDGMDENQQAALTSIAYNYGSLPERIVAAIKTGNQATVVQAIRDLGADNGGINRTRRNEEADLFLGGAPSGVKAQVAGQDNYKASLADIQRRIDLLNQESAVQAAVNPLIGDYGYAVEKARVVQELLNDAQANGIAITPGLKAHIDELAGKYAEASTSAAKLAEQQDQTRQSAEEWSSLGKNVLGGFISDLRAGKTASEALANALNKVADKLLDIALNSLFDSAGGGIFGMIGSFLGFSGGGNVQAFASGGHVRGPGTATSDSIPAMLSDGEFVVRAKQADKHRALLEAINSGNLPAFALGGSVGEDGKPARLHRPSNENVAPAANTFHMPVSVTVNATGGSPEDNADLARQTARETQEAVRAVVVAELINQTRPGGIMAAGSRRY